MSTKLKQFLKINESSKNHKSIETFLLETLQLRPKDFKINEDSSVELFCDLNFSKAACQTRARLPVKFSKINGDIWIHNCQLQTLIGLPDEHEGLVSLINVMIPDLSYFPKLVGQNSEIFISRCPHLKSLKGCPEEVGSTFNLNDLPNLESLEHGPKIVGTTYKVDTCGITSIDGIAETIGKNLILTNNRELKSLAGIHKKIKSVNGIVDVSGSLFKQNILGLFLVKGVKSYRYAFGGKAEKVFKIVEKNLEEGKDLLDIQYELMENPELERYAEL